MSTYLAIISVTLRRLLSRKRIFGLILFASIPAIVVALAATGDRGPDRLENLYHTLTVAILFGIALPVIGVVHATGALGDERFSHTLPFLALKPIRRWSIALSEMVGSIAATVLIGAIGVGLGWLAGGWATGSWDIGVGPAVALLVASVGYGAAFIPLGFLTRRATVIGLIYIFLWEAAFSNAIATLAPTSLWHIAIGAYADLAPGTVAEESLNSVTAGVGLAFIKVAVVAVVSLALTTWALRRRDLA